MYNCLENPLYRPPYYFTKLRVVMTTKVETNMAAAKTNTFNNNKMPHKGTTYMGNIATGNGLEITPELHLKMSKKIAQLTKVIYALNTKNDEHESIVDCLKERHENDMQRLLEETRSRTNELRLRIEKYEKEKTNMQSLEQRLHEESEKRKQILVEFEKYKLSAEEIREKMEEENELRASESIRLILHSKENFERQLEEFQNTRRLMEQDKDVAMQELVGKHHEELEQLMKAHRLRYDEVVKEKDRLKKNLEAQINELSSSPEVLRAEREKIDREYKTKLEKLKSLYENELSHVREETVRAQTLLKEYEHKEIDQKNTWRIQEKQYQNTISTLRKELDTTNNKTALLEKELSDFTKEVALKNDGFEAIMKQLNDAENRRSELAKELEETQTELRVSIKRSECLADELSHKTCSHNKLEATCLNQEQSVKELKKNVESSKERCFKLEEELKLLKNDKHSLETDSEQQLYLLKQNLESLENENEHIRSKYIEELASTKEESSKRENDLQTLHGQELSNMIEKHQQIISELKSNHETSLYDERRTQSRIITRKEKVSREKDKIIQENERKLVSLQKLYEEETKKVKLLSSRMEESEHGLDSASSTITALNNIIKEKQADVSRMEKELVSLKNLVEQLKNEAEATKIALEKEKSKAKLTLDQSLKDMRQQLTKEWSERLKSESSTLRTLLNEQHKDGQHAALKQLSALKEEEKKDIRLNAEKDMAILQTKINELEKELKDAASRFLSFERSLKETASKERKRIEDERSMETLEHQEKMNNLELKHQQELALFKEIKEQELKELEAKLKQQHDEETLSQLKASKLSMEVVKSQAELNAKEKMAEERVQFDKEKQILENELIRRRKDEINKMKNDFESQLSALKLQLQESDELRVKETDRYAVQVEELSSSILKNEVTMNEIKNQLSESQNNEKKLQDEVESKVQEIFNVRRETNNHIRKTEEKLAKAHQKEMDLQVADHLRETQNLVYEFNRAQEHLKEKCSALQLMLEEAEAKFRGRPPRDEDMEVIQSLKTALTLRDQELRKMLDEKRYYQLELLNRETNFNKVFGNSSPNIGVINPLQYKKKPGKDHLTGQGSAMTLTSSRLDPMPPSNLSVHEKKLNNTSPLPPTQSKKLSANKRLSVY
ncbi:protein FAM184A-like [Xenia sp. Carnegie-2017]|uniref:protein FAM184A-like n=1 Tax=Xenia sp. Carnegie-2017 TaxID=2897299 RepID=UPI001F04CE46|nr:protein FAM184A-like [Xenia sp. Carnegie-2017]